MQSLDVEKSDLYFHYHRLHPPDTPPHYHLFEYLAALPFSCEYQTSYKKDSLYFDSKIEVYVKTGVICITFHCLRSFVTFYAYYLC